MAKARKTAKKAPGTKPVEIVRQDGVSASVFANPRTIDGKTVNFFKVTFSKSYKKGDKFLRTQSFDKSDLPKLSGLIGQVAAVIAKHEATVKQQ